MSSFEIYCGFNFFFKIIRIRSTKHLNAKVSLSLSALELHLSQQHKHQVLSGQFRDY